MKSGSNYTRLVVNGDSKCCARETTKGMERVIWREEPKTTKFGTIIYNRKKNAQVHHILFGVKNQTQNQYDASDENSIKVFYFCKNVILDEDD